MFQRMGTLSGPVVPQTPHFSSATLKLFFIFIKCMFFKNSSYLFIYLWPSHAACGILGPPPGIEPMAPAVEAQSLNPWTAREVPKLFFQEELFILEDAGAMYDGWFFPSSLLPSYPSTVISIENNWRIKKMQSPMSTQLHPTIQSILLTAVRARF